MSRPKPTALKLIEAMEVVRAMSQLPTDPRNQRVAELEAALQAEKERADRAERILSAAQQLPESDQGWVAKLATERERVKALEEALERIAGAEQGMVRSVVEYRALVGAPIQRWITAETVAKDALAAFRTAALAAGTQETI